MPMFDPELWAIGLELGGIYMQRGINNFVAWAKKLRQDIGEDFEPWQKPLWETLKAMPKIEKFNDKQIWSTAKRIGYLYENGTTELEDIEKDFAEKLSAKTMKAITPMIRATYKGIQKFFADQQQASEEQAQEPETSETKKAAVTVTGDEFGEYDGIGDLRKKAVQYYSEHLQGTSVENETLGKIDIDENGLIEFTTAGKKKLQSTGRERNKLLLVKHLPKLLKTAHNIRTAESVKEKHKQDSFIYMNNDVEIDGDIVPIHITFTLIKRNNGEIQYYNHNFIKEDKKHASEPARPESSNEALGTLPYSVSSVEVETSAKNISQAEQSDKDKRNFEMGNFTNPETNQTQAGIRFTKILPQKEYARLEDIAAEYNGIYHEHGNMILFRNESDRDAFIDDATGNYRGTEITKPISQARTVTQLKQIFRKVYRVDLGAVEGLSMNIRRLKEFVGGLVDSLADAGLMKFVNGKVEYSNAKAYEEVKNAFAGMVQQKPVDATSKEPLPTIDSLKKKIRATLTDLNDAKITVSPQWDDAEERVATDAEDFSIIPTRTLAGDIFKISYGNFGLAAYDTESQALDALGELNAAVKRGDKEFVFPTDEQVNETSPAESEQTEPTTQGEIVYPDGALTFGKSRLAASEYLSTKNGLEGKPFIKNARITIEINGREMTRLEAIEEIAKGNVDNHPNIKKFLDENFNDVYAGIFKNFTVNKLRKYDSQQIEWFEKFLATSEIRPTQHGRAWLPSEEYLHEKFKTDTHPNLKARIEDYFAKALYETDAKESRSALADLEVLRRDEITDEDIERIEASLAAQNGQTLTNETKSEEKLSTTINPFDMEIPQNAITQSEDFQKAYGDMQAAWNDGKRHTKD